MKDLINKLKKETKTLKEQYVSKSIEWAKNNYEEYTKMGNFYYLRNRWFQRGFGSTMSEERKLNNIVKILNLGLDGYIKQTEENAIIHYDNSIEKLANRIIKKGLNIDNIKLSTTHIDYNIETIITDGEKTVRAFTILAWGDIQRPHYRYLIK